MSPSLAIRNADVLTPDQRLERSTVLVEGERIVAVGDQLTDHAEVEIDAAGLLLAPGFIDLQINGAFGMDFTAEPANIWPVAAQLPRYGVTTFLPTIVTSPLDTIARAQSVLLAGPPPGFLGAWPLGLHVEGPFLNPEKKGAHREDYLLPPRVEDFSAFAPEQGVRLVTLAPELPEALEVVRSLVERGILVSAGHTMATLDQARQAFASGVRYGTHLFNAMAPLQQFEPGVAGAILADPEVRFGLICDGIHVHPTLIALIWKLSGPGRMTLVTDAMAALGMPPGHYPLGGMREVIVDETSARLPNGVLAGSILSHDTALRNLIAFTGCTLEEALTCLTTTPAGLLGLSEELGRIEPGLLADIVLLTPDLQVAQTIARGRVCYTA